MASALLDRALAGFRHLPDVWGEGALFAFSGMDGRTNTESRFVMAFGEQRYSFLIHTPMLRTLTLALRNGGTVKCATGDVLAVDTPDGALLLTFTAWHSLVGLMPDNTSVQLADGSGRNTLVSRHTLISSEHDAIAVLVRSRRFAVAFGHTPEQALARAEQAITADPVTTTRERLATYSRLPYQHDAQQARLLNKAVSVMRVNTLAPEGVIRQHWSTPDRVPHRHLWLWDSVFHSLAMNHINPRLAYESLHAVMDRQREDGMVPHCMHVDGTVSAITQPPILAWGVCRNYSVLKDRMRISHILPMLERYLEWNLNNRDQNGNGLLEWFIEGDENCRSGESGMDNSPRFDAAIALDAVDFSTFQALDMQAVGKIAAELGDTSKSELWCKRSLDMRQRIYTELWNEDAGLYTDRDMDGKLSPVKAVSGFLPLLFDDVPPTHIERMMQSLADPANFASAFPIPSLSLDDAQWSTDMWRGATWINYDYLIYLGLRKHGKLVEANALRETLFAMTNKYYEQFGVLFEFYDARDAVPPTMCDRKGASTGMYDIHAKMDSIRDYHWTAALIVDMFLGK